MLRDASTSRPCERRDPYSADSRFGTGAEAFFTSEARGDGSLRSRLCENARGPRMRRIVFSFAFFRHGLTVQLVSTSTKSRLRFYTQVSCRTFHTAWNAGTHSHELGAFPLHRSIGRQHLRQQIILELGAGELAYEMDRSVGHADRTHQSELGLHEHRNSDRHNPVRYDRRRDWNPALWPGRAMPEIEARACRTLFPQPIGQLDAALAAQYRLPGDLFQFYRSVRSLCFERHPAMHKLFCLIQADS